MTSNKSEDRSLWLLEKGPAFYLIVGVLILIPLMCVAYYLDKEHEADMDRLNVSHTEKHDRYMVELNAIREELAELKTMVQELKPKNKLPD